MDLRKPNFSGKKKSEVCYHKAEYFMHIDIGLTLYSIIITIIIIKERGKTPKRKKTSKKTIKQILVTLKISAKMTINILAAGM